MGGVFGGGFSKSKQSSQSTSESGNKAFPFLQDVFGDTAKSTAGVADLIGQLLGVGGGGPSQSAAFKNFRDNSGYDFLMDEGSRAITGNRAASGLLNSGSTLKRLTEFGQQTANQSIGDYISRLLGLSQVGLNAGNIISDAGKYSDAQSTSKGSSFAANFKVGG